MTKIKISEIITNPNQPREYFDDKALAELAESIKNDGLMTPIMVRPLGDKYEIVQGERRYRASKMAGLSEVPVNIREMNDVDAFHLAVIENIQREQLSPIEEAQAFMKYVEMGFTHEQIAQKVSKGRTYITTKLRLLNLSPEIQDWIAEGRLAEGHAKKILTAKNDICRLMEVCRFLHGTEDSFEYIQRLLMFYFKDKEKISVKDIENYLSKFKYLLIRSELYWLSFLAFPEEIKQRESIQQSAFIAVSIALEMGANYSEISVDDVRFMFDYALKNKNGDTKAWKIYKALEEWEGFIRFNRFKEMEQEEIVDELRKCDLTKELFLY
ncbi:ParB/RepB/Spo0J family partition protein [Rummeliibacillus suwonensis]|uniref:ParB/RepB/Spo0J family partition protein n=1 Tax=Rummeliibacillus suwonensis TaxID=1306154 RepID=UPI0016451672|nr:ParB/RepB/Spo0J family partition protein [Rummeliibacillus suwonensis]